MKINYKGYTLIPEFNRYMDNDRTAILLKVDSTGEMFGDATVNIPDAFIPNDDYVVVKAYGFSEGLDDALIAAGLIEADVLTYARSGYITTPVYRLTDTAIEMRDAQYKEMGF